MYGQTKFGELLTLRRGFQYDEFLKLVEPGEVFSMSILENMTALHVFLFTCGYPTFVDADTRARMQVIKKLIAMKADINAIDSNGSTPLWNAVACYDHTIIPFLLEQGANPRVQPSGCLKLSAFACSKEKLISSCPIVRQFMLRGIKLEEFHSEDEGIAPNADMVKFYESILEARKAATIFIGLRQKCPLLKLIGKDVMLLIAKTIYQTRGNPVWNK